jgi:S1-C subfamily serine protease
MQQADKDLPLVLGEFGKGGIGPSDHTSFALKKIPVLFFFTGLHMDYHRPTDTAEKINYKGMDEVVDLGQQVVQAMTTMPREKYNGKYDASGLLAMAGPTSRPSNNPGGSRASMGAIPDYSQGEDAKGGMRIGGIVPDSPADKAGLRQGDLVTEFSGTKINNMMDYTAALATARPGQTVAVKVLRNGKPMEIQATLVVRKD